MPLKSVIFLAYAVFYLGSEIASAVVGLRTVRRSWPSWYKLLVIMCCATILMEGINLFLAIRGISTYTNYNTWLPIETFITVYVLYRETTQDWSRRLLKILLILLPLGLAISFSLPPGFTKPNMVADTVELIIELIAACAVLIDILQDMSGASLFTSPRFWLAAGTLGSSCIFALAIASRTFLKEDPARDFYAIPYSCAANAFMYGGIITCFIKLKRAQKGMVSPHKDEFPG